MASLKASLQHAAVQARRTFRVSRLTLSGWDRDEEGAPAMIAFVLAIAGMIFLTTPWVKLQVTPSML